MMVDNGAEGLSKVPDPNPEPAFYSTASEIAIRKLAEWRRTADAIKAFPRATKLGVIAFDI